ncbi:MAG: hypothetical protein A3K03_12065 [Bdellovibrionales bacterium RIFOXYD1_FULL_44_7]|nr:MAG: hypothetical protein A3K03_12065 [Bdellovibrionales bacterium RIFOXYD1_FULL_44_7]
MKNTACFIICCFFLLSAAQSFAAPPSVPAAKTNIPVVKVPRKLPDKLLWDSWYTITLNKTVHYSYFNERFELKDGNLFYQSKSWKQEEGYINEEQIGALSEYRLDLIPLFFNFHSTYRSTETTIDGNIKDGKILTVKIRKGNTDLPVIKRNTPGKAILSVFFPIWIGHRLAKMKQTQTLSFMTILEDNIEANFDTVHGQVRLDASDDIAMKTKTSKLSVNYRDLRSTWYVERNGSPVRIEIPGQKTLIERTTKEIAQKFLEE